MTSLRFSLAYWPSLSMHRGVLSICGHDTALVTTVVQWMPGSQNREMHSAVTSLRNLYGGPLGEKQKAS